MVLGEHVTLDAGTGAVHTAPGHGADDYELGSAQPPDRQSGRERRALCRRHAALRGLSVSTQTRRSSRRSTRPGKLIHHESYRHSYPHCWRHKSPVIFRATPQWFLSMEKAGLRRDALAAIRGVRWIPGWGEQRITSMIETRPDWCISRQRAWGVPLAMFLHKETGEPHPQTPELLEQVGRPRCRGRNRSLVCAESPTPARG